MSNPDRARETQRLTPKAPAGYDRIDLSAADFAGLVVGTVKLDDQGKVIKYNPFPPSPPRQDILGKNLFHEVVPFLPQLAAYYEQFLEGVGARRLYAEFRFHVVPEEGDPVNVQVMLFYTKNTDSFWALIGQGF